MNRVYLIGRVGGTPEVKELSNTKVAKFSLATSESYKKDGEKITDTTWHNLVFWGKQCDTIKEYVNKGDLLAVEGKIQVRQYKDKDGVNHWATEIVCDKFEMLGNKEKKEEKKSSAMSDINELPGNVANYDEIPDDGLSLL
jgi:single-strand DNA-binding protein